MIYGIFAALLLGAATGAGAERFGFARNGYIVSVALGVGGAVILVFLRLIFGVDFGLGAPGLAIIGAIAMLILAGRRR